METLIEPDKKVDALAHDVIDAPLGLLINFNVSILKDGIQRVVYTNNNSAAWRSSRLGG